MKKILQIGDYADDINLYDAFLSTPIGSENKEQLVDTLLVEMNEENSLSLHYSDKRRLLHARLNTLLPNTLGPRAIDKLNQFVPYNNQHNREWYYQSQVA